MSKTYEVSELGDMLIYQNEKGDTKVDVYFFDKDIWMSQAAIAQMYNTTPQNITMHIKRNLLQRLSGLLKNRRLL